MRWLFCCGLIKQLLLLRLWSFEFWPFEQLIRVWHSSSYYVPLQQHGAYELLTLIAVS